MINNILGWFNGKKTFLAAILTVVVVALFAFKKIDATMFETLAGGLAALGLWSLRDAVKKLEK